MADSITTGVQNTVVWAAIHHKTAPTGGGFGYPDPTYFRRVYYEELKPLRIESSRLEFLLERFYGRLETD